MTVVWILLFAVLGAAAGAVHFIAISRDADLLVRGGSPLVAFGLRLGRLLLTITLLVAAAREGWPVLLAAVIGFMAARHMVLRRLGGAPR